MNRDFLDVFRREIFCFEVVSSKTILFGSYDFLALVSRGPFLRKIVFLKITCTATVNICPPGIKILAVFLLLFGFLALLP